LSVMRASTVVKRQSRGWAAVLRRACQAATSVWRVATAGPRRARPWRLSTLSSISAMFNQRPCLGVEWLASRSARRLTSAGGNAAAREVGVCGFRVSMTSTIRADLRVAWGVGPGIALEDVLHSPAERGVRLGREAPLPLLPRLQLVFFRIRRTGGDETASAISRSPSLSASRRRDQRGWPVGGAPQVRGLRR
jgi:hypothetical protein